MIFVVSLLALVLLLFLLSAFQQGRRSLSDPEAEQFLSWNRSLFFYRPLLDLFRGETFARVFDFHNRFSMTFLRLACGALTVAVAAHEQWSPPVLLFALCISALLVLLVEGVGRLYGALSPGSALRVSASPISLLWLCLLPVLLPFHLLSQVVMPKDFFRSRMHQEKRTLIELIEASDLGDLDSNDKRLIESVMDFKDRIAREIMVPRIDVFGLPAEMTVESAAKILYREGYSRIPVYKDQLDQVVGVLMYKDVFTRYMESVEQGERSFLDQTLGSLAKGVIYTPETKKISHLLQEFRTKQVHFAVVVDEYGGTSGIVTIEDILEAIVGEIADEHDTEEALYTPLPDGGWLVDARMSLFDLEEQLDVAIPQEGDYDTIGGYIFHETGMIPQKGYLIQRPQFEIEVMRSDDRRVMKVRLKRLSS